MNATTTDSTLSPKGLSDMLPTINNNAQAYSLRLEHEKAYFIQVGSVTTLHPTATFIATSYLGLAIAALAGMMGHVTPAMAFTAILGVSTILFIAWAGVMLVAADRIKKIMSAVQPSDIPEMKTAGIFKVNVKVVKK